MLPTPDAVADSRQERGLLHWRRTWRSSLRHRLLVLGLMPLLVAFPLVMAVLVLVGGERVHSLLDANLRTNLAASLSYLNQRKADTAVRVVQLARSERLVRLLAPGADQTELQQVLVNAADTSGLDFLLVASTDGRVLASSTGVAPGQMLPESFVVRQARIGVANAAYERFVAGELAAYSPHFAQQSRVPLPGGQDGPLGPGTDGGEVETRGLFINAAAPFALSTDRPDAILVGGVLLNRNLALIEHMREVIFPLGTLPDGAEGMSALYIDEHRVAISRSRQQGQGLVGSHSPPGAWQAVRQHGQVWLGHAEQQGQSMRVGFEPLLDGNGQRVAMVSASFPDAPYRKAAWWMLGAIAVVLSLALLAISIVFLRTGSTLSSQLRHIVDTMTAVRSGNRQARVGAPRTEDEPGQLARHFDTLLDTIAQQDAAQRAAQQTLADEASRRRALFEHERDGVLILNADGSVFEANPQGAAMLGYAPDELARLHVSQWDTRHDARVLAQLLAGAGAEGLFFETVLRRKDGSTYSAEISLSLAQWSDRSFVLWLQRDITKRKAADAELARYRDELQALVAQRTQALNDRTEQLDAIFNLSPAGFVAFDLQHRVMAANHAFEQLTGLTAEALQGLDEAGFAARLQAQCDKAAMFPDMAALRAANARATGTAAPGAQDLRFELAAPQARVVAVELRVSDTAGVSQILSLRDITHETEVERMKSEFLTTAAHELRTPMASIYGYAELLMAREFKPEKQRELLATISHQSQVMSSIINELLDLARIESRRGKDFVIARHALHEPVQAAIGGYHPPQGRPGPVVLGDGASLFAEFDPSKLEQAVTNILSNAYKYSPGGGAVTVQYLQDPGSDANGSPARVGVAVQDCGLGMTPEQAARIFERFYRADASGHIPGTGLGMSIVKEIIELQHGSVQVVSEAGVGTSVTLWLPRAQ